MTMFWTTCIETGRGVYPYGYVRWPNYVRVYHSHCYFRGDLQKSYIISATRSNSGLTSCYIITSPFRKYGASRFDLPGI